MKWMQLMDYEFIILYIRDLELNHFTHSVLKLTFTMEQASQNQMAIVSIVATQFY